MLIVLKYLFINYAERFFISFLKRVFFWYWLLLALNVSIFSGEMSFFSAIVTLKVALVSPLYGVDFYRFEVKAVSRKLGCFKLKLPLVSFKNVMPFLFLSFFILSVIDFYYLINIRIKA